MTWAELTENSAEFTVAVHAILEPTSWGSGEQETEIDAIEEKVVEGVWSTVEIEWLPNEVDWEIVEDLEVCVVEDICWPIDNVAWPEAPPVVAWQGHTVVVASLEPAVILDVFISEKEM